MSKWIVKAIVQKIISFFPQRERINFFFQKYITKGVLLTDAHFELKLSHAADHIRFFRDYGGTIAGSRVLELGTGWYPIVPISLFLNEVQEVITIDIQSWMTKERIIRTIHKFLEWKQEGKIAEYLNDASAEKWSVLEQITEQEASMSKETICRKLGIVPMLEDARNTGIDTASMDFICSNNTFEHVYKDVLKGILAEFQHVCKVGGVMSHFIDLSDHFAHADHRITIYNFLKFSERSWQLIDNCIQPQNRLRFKNYKEMYQSLGIPVQEEKVRPGDLKELDKIKLAKEYEGYTKEELAISHGYIISKM